MRTPEARILDSRHLELTEPLSAPPGDLIRIAITDGEGEMDLWRRAGRQRFLEVYDPADGI
jgi:hypothetical protein